MLLPQKRFFPIKVFNEPFRFTQSKTFLLNIYKTMNLYSQHMTRIMFFNIEKEREKNGQKGFE